LQKMDKYIILIGIVIVLIILVVYYGMYGQLFTKKEKSGFYVGVGDASDASGASGAASACGGPWPPTPVAAALPTSNTVSSGPYDLLQTGYVASAPAGTGASVLTWYDDNGGSGANPTLVKIMYGVGNQYYDVTAAVSGGGGASCSLVLGTGTSTIPSAMVAAIAAAYPAPTGANFFAYGVTGTDNYSLNMKPMFVSQGMLGNYNMNTAVGDPYPQLCWPGLVNNQICNELAHVKDSGVVNDPNTYLWYFCDSGATAWEYAYDDDKLSPTGMTGYCGTLGTGAYGSTGVSSNLALLAGGPVSIPQSIGVQTQTIQWDIPVQDFVLAAGTAATGAAAAAATATYGPYNINLPTFLYNLIISTNPVVGNFIDINRPNHFGGEIQILKAVVGDPTDTTGMCPLIDVTNQIQSDVNALFELGPTQYGYSLTGTADYSWMLTMFPCQNTRFYGTYTIIPPNNYATGNTALIAPGTNTTSIFRVDNTNLCTGCTSTQSCVNNVCVSSMPATLQCANESKVYVLDASYFVSAATGPPTIVPLGNTRMSQLFSPAPASNVYLNDLGPILSSTAFTDDLLSYSMTPPTASDLWSIVGTYECIDAP